MQSPGVVRTMLSSSDTELPSLDDPHVALGLCPQVFPHGGGASQRH